MTAKAIEYNKWEIITGVDFRQRFLLRDPTQPKITNPDYDPTQPESPINQPTIYPPKDLSGYTGRMDIRDSKSKNGNLIYTIDTTSGGMTMNDPGIGWITLFIDNTVTKTPPISENIGDCNYFDLFITPSGAGADIEPLFVGTITISEPITDV